MYRKFRTIVPAVLAAGFLVVVAVYPEDISDLSTATRDLRQTLRDFDKRLRQLEQMVKTQSKDKKTLASRAGAAPLTPAADASAKFQEAQEAYSRGRIEEDAKQYPRAVELYSTAVSLDPGNDSAFLHRAMVERHLGKFDEALADVNHSLVLQPNNAQAYAFRANVYLGINDYSHALEDIEQALLRDSRNPDYLLSQAAVEEHRGNYRKAVEVYGTALQIKADGHVYLKNAAAMRRLKLLPESADQCTAAITFQPTAAAGHMCRAETYVQLGLLPQALSDVQQAVGLDPAVPQASNLLTVIRQLVDTQQAVTAAAQSAPAPPTNAAQPTAVAATPVPAAAVPAPVVATPAPTAAAPVPTATALLPNAAKAVSAATNAGPVAATQVVPAQPPTSVPPPVQAVRSTPPPSSNPAPRPPAASPKRVSDLLTAAREFMDQGMVAAAVPVLDQALALDPKSAVAHNSRGYAFLRARDYGAAIRDFSSAIQINPLYANAYWNRGVARRLMGDRDGGKQDMQRAGQLGFPPRPLASAEIHVQSTPR